MYLTLGLTIDRFREGLFTGSYYLSKTTRWATMWVDIPRECYKRIGFMLKESEMLEYYKSKGSDEVSYDIWWDGNSTESVMDFLQMVERTENRFLEQPDLIKKITRSKTVNEYWHQAQKVIKLVLSRVPHDDLISFNYTPHKNIDDIPIIWFIASEKVLLEEKAYSKNKKDNKNITCSLAADAFRLYKLG